MMEYSLSFVDAKIVNMQYQEGMIYRTLFFDCPLDTCKHLCVIPFHDSEAELISIGRVWQRVDGTTVEDITLSPSYWLKTTCGLHCLIKNGKVQLI